MTDDRPTLRLDVEGAYDLWAAMYDDVPTSLVVGAEEVVAGFAKLVHGRDVIELGCGSGRNLANFAKQGAKSLSGIDASSKMLAKAVEVAKSASLAQGDYSKITPFAEQSADFVLFCLTLEHIENLGEPLLEAARLMRPGGFVGIVEIHPELASKGVKACFETPEALVEMPTFFHPGRAYRDLTVLAAVGHAPMAAFVEVRRSLKRQQVGGFLNVRKRGCTS